MRALGALFLLFVFLAAASAADLKSKLLILNPPPSLAPKFPCFQKGQTLL